MKRAKILPLLTLALLLMAIIAQAAISFNHTQGSLMQISSDSFSIGEQILIILDINTLNHEFANYKLKITTKTNVFKYSGQLSEQIIFNAKEQGEHSITLFDYTGKTIEEQKFFVIEKEEVL